MPEQVPANLGRYVIQEEIGRGMMGAVYRALDPELGRTVALKTVRLAFSASTEEQERFERRFMAEARAAAVLSHPNIVIVYDVGRDPESNVAFIALEHLAGRTLESMAAEGPLDWREACRISARIADGLFHAHQAGIVHRDIKPANVMVLPNGEPKIMDFGIAKLPAAKLTVAGQFFGSPAYMSPEQAEGAALDGRSDLFSLGAVLYQLLTGKRAFSGPSVTAIISAVLSKDPELPSRIVPGLPAVVDRIVFRALAKDRARRYPDGRALAEDLDDAREERPPRHAVAWTGAAPADSTIMAGRRLRGGADSATGPPGTIAHGDLRPRTTRAAGTIPRRAAPTAGPTSRLAPLLIAGGALGLIVMAGLAVLVYRSLGITGREERPAAVSADKETPSPAKSVASATHETPTPVEPSTLDRLVKALLPIDAGTSRLAVNLEHPLKNGRIRIWIDENVVLDEPLAAPVKKKVLIYKSRKGRLEETLEVEPGEHVVRVRFDWDDNVQSDSIQGQFVSGRTRHLSIRLGGLIKKHLKLEWE